MLLILGITSLAAARFGVREDTYLYAPGVIGLIFSTARAAIKKRQMPRFVHALAAIGTAILFLHLAQHQQVPSYFPLFPAVWSIFAWYNYANAIGVIVPPPKQTVF
jgi:hypothetical protein